MDEQEQITTMTGEQGEPAEPGDEKSSRKKEIAKKALRALTAAGKRKLVKILIVKTAEALQKDVGKTSLADLIRLMALEKELEAEKKPSKITVEWIDPRTGKPWRTPDQSDTN